MCHHLLNSLTTIKNISRGNNHSSFNRSFIDLQPEEGKMRLKRCFFTSQKEKASDLTLFYLRSENAKE